MKRLILLSLLCCLLTNPPCPAQSEPLPKYALKRFGSTKLRHGSPIQCLAFSADDKTLAAGGSDDFVLWNVETGEPQRRLPQSSVTALAFSPHGKLAAADNFKKIHVWDPANGMEIAVLSGHSVAVKSLAYSADGSILASGAQDGAVILWRPYLNEPLDRLIGHVEEVAALAFSPNGSLLASAGSDRTIRVWSLKDKEAKPPSIDGGCAVTGLVFSDDGKILISAGDDNLIRLWDPATGKALDTFKGHEDSVASLLLSRDGKTLVSGGRGKSIRFWDLAARKPGRVHERDANDGDALAMSGNGKLLAYAGHHNTIHLVETDSGKELFAGPGATAPITQVGLSRDGNTLIAVGMNRMMLQWHVPTSKVSATYRAGPLGDLTVPYALSALNQGGPIKQHDTITSTDPIVAVAATLDGRTFAIGHRSGAVDLQRQDGDKIVLQTVRYPGIPHVLAFTQDGKKLAVSGNSKVVVFDVAAAKKIQQFTSTQGPGPKQPRVASLAISPSGKHLAVGGYDGVARLFDVATGKQTTFFQGHLSAVLGLAFSPDSRVLATGSFDRSVRLWETFNGSEQQVQFENDVGLIASYSGHVGAVQAVCFAADGRTLFSGSSDTTILHWDATRKLSDGVLPVVGLRDDDLDDAWTKLTTLDAGRGQEVAWRMVSGAKEAVPYLSGKVAFMDSKQIEQLFTDLNDDAFAVRFKATEELLGLCKKHGMWMRSRLDDAVRHPKSEEGRNRADQILDKLVSMPSALPLAQERVRLYRSMQVLEQAATPAAAEILEKLAHAAPERALQAEAQFALERLKKKTPEK